MLQAVKVKLSGKLGWIKIRIILSNIPRYAYITVQEHHMSNVLNRHEIIEKNKC